MQTELRLKILDSYEKVKKSSSVQHVVYPGKLKVQKTEALARQIHSIAPSQNKQAAALHHAVKLAGVRNLIQRCSRRALI